MHYGRTDLRGVWNGYASGLSVQQTVEIFLGYLPDCTAVRYPGIDRMKWVESPPQHVLLNQSFRVAIAVDCPPSALSLTLAVAGSNTSLPGLVEENRSSNIGTHFVRLRITQKHTGSAVLCVFSQTKLLGVSRSFKISYGFISFCVTSPRSFALQVTVQPVREWFKDEGGKANHIRIQCQVRDASGHAVLPKAVNLAVKLLYDAPGYPEVFDQSILSINPEHPPQISAQGLVLILCRVSEVSKNHQKQDFRFQIAPADAFDSLGADIAPAITDPVTVLSKRIKNRKRLVSDVTPDDSDGAENDFKKKVRVEESEKTASHSNDLKRLFQELPLEAAVKEWCSRVEHGFEALEWQIISHDDQCTIRRCPYCKVIRFGSDSASHASHCLIASSLALLKEGLRPAYSVPLPVQNSLSTQQSLILGVGGDDDSSTMSSMSLCPHVSQLQYQCLQTSLQLCDS